MKEDFFEVMFWFGIYELQITEEEIANEILYPASGKPGKLPSPDKMRKRVDERIAERREKIKRKR